MVFIRGLSRFQLMYGRTGLTPRYSNNGRIFDDNNRHGVKVPQTIRTEKNADGSTTTYRADGSKIISDDATFGKTYSPTGALEREWTNKDGIYTENVYDADGRVIFTRNKVENEEGVVESDIFRSCKYDDNGNLIMETTGNCLNCEITAIKYDENGNMLEKSIQKGAVTTYYDAEDKPIRKETDKGQGVVVTEDLTE